MICFNFRGVNLFGYKCQFSFYCHIIAVIVHLLLQKDTCMTIKNSLDSSQHRGCVELVNTGDLQSQILELEGFFFSPFFVTLY